MNRRDFLKTAGCAAAGTSLLRGQAASRKPNIIFILADDLGIGDLSCYGSDKFRSPNIDRLAAGGTRYNHAYTAPLCGPSRSLIMTGRYAFRTGATNQDATGEMTPKAETFMPTYLKQAGYVTASVGKWGQLPLGPAEFGFDEHFKFTGSGTYWNTQERGKRYLVNGEVKTLHDKEYIPDLMHTFLVDFMTRHREKPFYIYYSMAHIHGEILPTPDSKPGSDNYADNIAYMDKLVGKLVSELERLKLRENTLLVFIGDNGTGSGYADVATIGGKRLSGQKGSMLEGGALVPMFVNWPGNTPAGKVSNELIDSTDFVPTFAELAGVKLPADKVIDGRSFLPQIYGRKGNPREWIFIELARNWYVRDSRWKLDQAGKLYDMKNSPFAEPEVLADTKDADAVAGRKKLQVALDKLNPAGGILDQGDGTGRHAGRAEKKAAQRKKKREDK
jgi:arylsulfatase A